MELSDDAQASILGNSNSNLIPKGQLYPSSHRFTRQNKQPIHQQCPTYHYYKQNGALSGANRKSIFFPSLIMRFLFLFLIFSAILKILEKEHK